ncbi:MAG TPA: hypothetical protein VGS12_12925 [Caulobacteraceae bacterium]|nr:hypothetical protein [Caulobacteraceae bacterium]
MTSHLRLPLAAAAALAATTAAAAPQSAAVDIDAHFTSRGVASVLGPIGKLVGAPSGSYNDSQTTKSASESVPAAEAYPTPTAFANGQMLSSHVTASFGVDTRSSEADTGLTTANVSLNLNPPPPTGQVPQPWLSLTVSQASADASFSQLFVGATSRNYATGSAKFGGFTAFGQFLGSTRVSYSGSPPPNTVVYSSPTVTITLNRQLQTGIISCSPDPCTFTPTSIDVAAVDVELNKADFRGAKVSGHILLGDNKAR